MGEVTIYIDDKEIKAQEGARLLDVALENGIEIPHLCYHPALRVHGSCRLCLVEIEGIPKLQPACNTYVKDGMKVKTNTPRVLNTRKLMLELLLINHPLDCPICDKSGECKLQDYTYKYGPKTERTKEKRRTFPYQYIGDKIVRNMNRCIYCTRCVRFVRDVVGIDEYGIFERGYHTTISTYVPETLTNEHQGNLHDICPVGALTTRDFRFKKRVWYLEKTESICPFCATGCNIEVHHHLGKIYRLVPRRNDKVNGFFMCDSGRFGFHLYEENRLTKPLYRGEEIELDKALEKAADLVYASKGFAVIGGGRLTNEDLYIMKKFIDNVKPTEFIDYRVLDEQKKEDFSKKDFLISNHRVPNSKGAKYFGFDRSSIEDIINKAKSGEIDLIFVLKENPPKYGIDIPDNVNIILFSAFDSDFAKKAYLAFPMASPFETGGSYTNFEGYVQSKKAAIPAPSQEVKPFYEFILEIAKRLGKDIGSYSGYEEIFKEMNLPERIEV